MGWIGTRALAVLVVDDDAEAAAALCGILEGLGHRAAAAIDGRDAIRRLKHGDFDLVLLDIGLPDMDGYAVARRLTMLGQRGMSMVALTGFSSDEDLRRADGAGFDELVVKPCGVDRLEGILERVLRRLIRGGAAG